MGHPAAMKYIKKLLIYQKVTPAVLLSARFQEDLQRVQAVIIESIRKLYESKLHTHQEDKFWLIHS